MKDISILAIQAIHAIRRAGCEGEVFVEDGRAARIVVSRGQVEAFEVRRDRGVGVRTFRDGRVGFSFTTDLSAEGITRAVERAREIAFLVGADEANRLPEDPGTPELVATFDPALESVPVQRKIALARAAEEAALSADPRVKAVREATYQDQSGTYRLSNTRGLSRTFSASRAVVSVELAAGDGSGSQNGWHTIWRMGAEGLDPLEAGREAARKALAKLGAEPARTARTSVVLSPEVTASLFGELSALFSAEAVLKGRSLLAGRMGEPIASSHVTLVDDGRHPAGYFTAPVDGEGVATRRTALVEAGVLRSYLQSTYTAARMNTSPTGNALRGGYMSRPQISRTNLYLEPTGGTSEQLIAGVSEGLYLTEVMGLHTINPVTGDFSLAASGRTIRSGRLDGPVDRMAFAGNILDLLKSIEAVADDLRFLINGGGATVLLREISISGK